jgi:hypothetical protein
MLYLSIDGGITEVGICLAWARNGWVRSDMAWFGVDSAGHEPPVGECLVGSFFRSWKKVFWIIN